MKKITFFIMVLFLASSLAVAQDLVEAAKKEKERRARLKKKSAIIVTNADLYETDKKTPRRTSSREEEDQDTQRTTPQKPQRATPSAPQTTQKPTPSQQIENIDQMDLKVDKVEQSDQLDAMGFTAGFAKQVFETTQLVENAQAALDEPDGNYASIGLFGSLDLEIDVKNGSGDDIAVYAKRQLEGPQTETRNYGVFVEHRGEWEFVGLGGGITSPETFDLGEIQSAKKIRIVFRDLYRSMWMTRAYQHQDASYSMSMGIDAVKSLHR
jgi:hypothetical protein